MKDKRGRPSSSRDPAKPLYHRELPAIPADEVREHKLYIGNLDPRATEYMIVKLFTPYGKIVREEFLWHTHGARRGEPRGYCFVEYSARVEAENAIRALNRKDLLGRPLVVRFVEDRNEEIERERRSSPKPRPAKRPYEEERGRTYPTAPLAGHSTEAKIAALQCKLKTMQSDPLPI